MELRPDIMFPLQRGNELANSLHHHRAQHKISEDLIILDDYDSLVVDFSHKKLGSGTSRRPKKILYGADTSGNSNSDEYKKKMVHREIEKQRRQEMATLHASLRSLLPLDFIKVKNLYFSMLFNFGNMYIIENTLLKSA